MNIWLNKIALELINKIHFVIRGKGAAVFRDRD